MRIAVTSVSGQLGSAIAQQLIKEIGADNVIGIARNPAKASHLGIEIREGDYNNRQQFELALKDVDTVMLLSGMDAPDKRIQQHRNVIDAALTNGVNKIVYTSIVGDNTKTAFAPIIQSNRQTEQDIKNTGLQWVIGRNGLYIEPDIDYIDQYIIAGEISNCAGDGLCAYTSRTELAYAYSKMLSEEKHNRQTYNLVGESITQDTLAEYLNQVYKTHLIYSATTVEQYAQERKSELGEFIGTVIGGIYEGIRNGAFNPNSDYECAAGRKHRSTLDIIKAIKERTKI